MPNDDSIDTISESDSIRNVQKVVTDRRQRDARSSRSGRRGMNRARSVIRRPRQANQQNSPDDKKENLLQKFRKWRIFGLTISATVNVYVIQIFFGVLTLVGFIIMGGGEADWLVSAADFLTFGSVTNIAVGFFWIGAAGAFLCGIITYAVALAIFIAHGTDGLRGINLLVLSVCLVGLLCPVLNFFPLVWLWCLYMTLASEQS